MYPNVIWPKRSYGKHVPNPLFHPQRPLPWKLDLREEYAHPCGPGGQPCLGHDALPVGVRSLRKKM